MSLDHFSLVAPIYDLVFGRMDAGRLGTLLDLPTEGWLLDAGGGTGRVSQRVRDQVGRVVIADFSAGMLQQSRRKAGLSGTQARVQRLPFCDGAFERIMVVDSWHHFDDQHGAAAELVRVLAPGGRLVIEDFNRDRWPVKLLALSERLLLMRSRFLNSDELADMFRPYPVRVTLHADHPANVWVVVEK